MFQHEGGAQDASWRSRPQAPLTSTLGCGLQGRGALLHKAALDGRGRTQEQVPTLGHQPTSHEHHAPTAGPHPWRSLEPGDVGPGLLTLRLMEKQMEAGGSMAYGLGAEFRDSEPRPEILTGSCEATFLPSQLMEARGCGQDQEPIMDTPLPFSAMP